MIFLLGVNRTQSYDLAKVRTEMLAGCVDTAGDQARPQCGCLIDEMMARNGTSAEDLGRLEAEIGAVEKEGAPLPASYQQAGEVCARKAGYTS